MIGAHSYTGGGNELTDSTRAFLPEARILHAFDPGRQTGMGGQWFGKP